MGFFLVSFLSFFLFLFCFSCVVFLFVYFIFVLFLVNFLVFIFFIYLVSIPCFNCFGNHICCKAPSVLPLSTLSYLQSLYILAGPICHTQKKDGPKFFFHRALSYPLTGVLLTVVLSFSKL